MKPIETQNIYARQNATRVSRHFVLAKWVLLSISAILLLWSTRSFTFLGRHDVMNVNVADKEKQVQNDYEPHIKSGFIATHYALGWWDSVYQYYSNATSWMEAGSGECGLVRHMLERNLSVKGVEISQAAINQGCPDLFSQGIVMRSSLTDIPFPDNAFDMVFSSEVMEHIPEIAVPSVIKELRRVSKGRLFLSISLRRSRLDPKPPKKPRIHVTVKTRDWWQYQFQHYGKCFVDTKALSTIRSINPTLKYDEEPWIFAFICGK